MDIYSAEIQVNKLLNYVKGLSDAKPRMYRKSKDRLKELANTCNEVVFVISELLQDEALVNNDDSDEFGGSDTTDFNSVLNSMEGQIAELRQFLNGPKTLSESIISTDDKKKALYTYKTCLQNLSNADIPVVEAKACGKLLWDWFSTRYLECKDNFRYSMRKVPTWIQDIVIFYGLSVENHSSDKFSEDLMKWVREVAPGTNFSVPYNIYQFDKKPDSKVVTLTAVVIWDILLDYGLRDLCSVEDTELYPTEGCVFDLVGSLNSEIMNPYTNYNYDSSILKRCNLTVRGR